ncbi:hypothetical protein PIECOFPK_00137 [Mycovorax composti]|jgi:DoxX.|uniref:DoxX family membrane protein n=2 Tax=Chitinophagaceae TaxID=563835 RepID=A0ABZ2EG17_9BACT
MKIVKNILCVLFALMFINAGLDKFFHYMPVPPADEATTKLYEAIGTISWLMPLVGTVEVVGGLLFLFPKTRALAALIILPVMVGILVHTATFFPSGLLIVILMFVVLLWVIASNWNRYKILIN